MHRPSALRDERSIYQIGHPLRRRVSHLTMSLPVFRYWLHVRTSSYINHAQRTKLKCYNPLRRTVCYSRSAYHRDNKWVQWEFERHPILVLQFTFGILDCTIHDGEAVKQQQGSV